jgi:NADH-quinone oxidoreductase subunit F
VAPTRIITKNGKVNALECQRMRLGEFDARGRRRPVPIEGSEFTLSVDTVVAAIGQSPDLSCLPSDSGFEIARGQTFVVDPVTLATNKPGIFAGGDVVTGPATVIEAMAAGERAAISIDKYLQGKSLTADRLRPPDERVTLLRAAEEMEEKQRTRMPTLPTKERLGGFSEANLGYSEERAIEEARRCLRCDLEHQEGRR